jgi:glycerophosphoryl diester phosphodiesterase
VSRFAFLDHPGPIPFAHRGGAGDWPENSWPAFEHAVSLGFRYVESDVQVTADGVALAFHDHRLDRVTDLRGRIADRPWSEVKHARIGGREPIVVLEDLLAAYDDVRFNLDPKTDRTVEPLVAALERTGAHHRVCLGSFSDRRLARLRRLLGPDVCMSGGPAAIALVRARSLGARVRVPDLACVQVPVRMGPVPVATERFVATAHRYGIKVHIWTVDDADEMHRLLDIGVDGIMTDRPAVLRDVLGARDEWHGHPGTR